MERREQERRRADGVGRSALVCQTDPPRQKPRGIVLNFSPNVVLRLVPLKYISGKGEGKGILNL